MQYAGGDTERQKGSAALSGVRVVELGGRRAVKCTGVLLANQGADVVEIDTGEPHELDTAELSILRRGKRYLNLSIDKKENISKIIDCLGRADVVIEGNGAAAWKERGIDLRRLMKQQMGRLIACSLPPYPSTDPRISRCWTEQSVSADAGLYETSTGLGKPHCFSLPLASSLTALHAAAAIAMALITRHRTGRGTLIEISHYRAALASQILVAMIRSNPPTQWHPFQMLSTPFTGIWNTADNNHLYIHLGIPRHLHTFLITMGRAGFTGEKSKLKKVLSAATKRDPVMVKGVMESIRITTILHTLFKKKSADYWEKLLCDAGLCCVKIRTCAQWRSHPQPRESGEILTTVCEDGSAVVEPGRFIHFKSSSPVRSPAAQECTDYGRFCSAWDIRETGAEKHSATLPLEGVKVLDFSRVIAGPYAGRLFAEYGAEVVHVTFRRDFLGWEEPFVVAFNGGKKSIYFNRSLPEGKAAYTSFCTAFAPDIVVHNFGERTARRLGVDYATMRSINPGVIFIDIAAYNATGPWRTLPGFEWNIQAVCGMMKEGDESIPRSLSVPYNDLAAGLLASVGGAVAYYRKLREKQGEEVSVCLSSAALLALLGRLNDDRMQSRWEKQAARALNGYYRTRDTEIFLSVPPSAVSAFFTLSPFEQCAGMNPSLWPKYIGSVLRRKPMAFWENRILESGLERRVIIIRRKKAGAVLQQELHAADPLFEYRFHRDFGDVLVANTPVSAKEIIGTSCKPASAMGSDTSEVLCTYGIMSESDTGERMPVQSTSGGIAAALDRVRWYLLQAKWIAAIVYRKFLFDRRHG
jgi:crotonobetainyl-CoA:carnitine CoA-transferase CaiB-like acyl-CoA transferase